MSSAEIGPSQLEFRALRNIIIQVNEIDWKSDVDLSEQCAENDYFFTELMGRICGDEERSQIIGSFRWYISSTASIRYSRDLFFRLMHTSIMKNSSIMHQDLSTAFILVCYATSPFQFFESMQMITNHCLSIGSTSLQFLTTMLTLLLEAMSTDIELSASFFQLLSTMEPTLNCLLKAISESIRLGIPSGVNLCLLVSPWLVCLSSSSSCMQFEAIQGWLISLMHFSRHICNAACNDDGVMLDEANAAAGIVVNSCDLTSTSSSSLVEMMSVFLENLPCRMKKVQVYYDDVIRKVVLTVSSCRDVSAEVNCDVFTSLNDGGGDGSAIKESSFTIRCRQTPAVPLPSSSSSLIPQSPFSFISSSSSITATTPRSKFDMTEGSDFVQNIWSSSQWKPSGQPTPNLPMTTMTSASPLSSLTSLSMSKTFASNQPLASASDVSLDARTAGDDDKMMMMMDDEEVVIGIAVCKNEARVIVGIRLVTSQRMSPWMGSLKIDLAQSYVMSVFGNWCCKNCTNCNIKLMAVNKVSCSSWCNTCEKKWSCSHQHAELMMFGRGGLTLNDLTLCFKRHSMQPAVSSSVSSLNGQQPANGINYTTKYMFRSCLKLFQIYYCAFPGRTTDLIRNECAVNMATKSVAAKLFRSVTNIPLFLVTDLMFSRIGSSQADMLISTHSQLTSRMAEYICSSSSSSSSRVKPTGLSGYMALNAPQTGSRSRSDSEAIGDPIHAIPSNDSNILLSESLVSAFSQSSLTGSSLASTRPSFDMSIGSPVMVTLAVGGSSAIRTTAMSDQDGGEFDTFPTPTSIDGKTFDLSSPSPIRPSSPCQTMPSMSQLHDAIRKQKSGEIVSSGDLSGQYKSSSNSGCGDDGSSSAVVQAINDDDDDGFFGSHKLSDERKVGPNYAGAHSLLVDQLKHHKECLKEDIPDRLTKIAGMYKEFLDIRHHNINLTRCDVSTAVCLLDVIDHLHGTLDQVEKEVGVQECSSSLLLQSFQARKNQCEDELALVKDQYERMIDDCEQSYNGRIGEWIAKYRKEIGEMNRAKEDSRSRMAKLERRCEGLTRELDARKQLSDDTIAELHRLHIIEEKFTTLNRLTELGQSNSLPAVVTYPTSNQQQLTGISGDSFESEDKWRTLFHTTIEQDTTERNEEFLRISTNIQTHLNDFDELKAKTAASLSCSNVRPIRRRSFGGSASHQLTVVPSICSFEVESHGNDNHLIDILSFLCSEVSRSMNRTELTSTDKDTPLLKLVGSICTSWRQYSKICRSYSCQLERKSLRLEEENLKLQQRIDRLNEDITMNSLRFKINADEWQSRFEFLSRQLRDQCMPVDVDDYVDDDDDDAHTRPRTSRKKQDEKLSNDDGDDDLDEGIILTPKSILMDLKDDYYTSTPPETRAGRSQSLKVPPSYASTSPHAVSPVVSSSNPSTPQFKTSRIHEISTRTTSSGSSIESQNSESSKKEVQKQKAVEPSESCLSS